MNTWQGTVERIAEADAGRHSRSAAYTLMELLVVMGIIAILAGLTVVVWPAVVGKVARSTAQSKLREVLLAIQAYHLDLNAYPPDNPGNFSRPPLLYELTGTAAQTQPQPDGTEPVTAYGLRIQEPRPSFTPAEIEAMFGRKGFRNSGEAGGTGRNYLPNLKSKDYAPYPADPLPLDRQPRFLGVPLKGPDGDFSRWRYNSSNPTNNPGSFDLETQIMAGRKLIRVGN
jgi:prepilin-type N-terminal cleavage/methylation domain-containing protein